MAVSTPRHRAARIASLRKSWDYQHGPDDAIQERIAVDSGSETTSLKKADVSR
jgi:hypothetical protein